MRTMYAWYGNGYRSRHGLCLCHGLHTQGTKEEEFPQWVLPSTLWLGRLVNKPLFTTGFSQEHGNVSSFFHFILFLKFVYFYWLIHCKMVQQLPRKIRIIKSTTNKCRMKVGAENASDLGYVAWNIPCQVQLTGPKCSHYNASLKF